MPSPHHTHLRRLDRAEYRGHAYVHWSQTMQKRATGWLTSACHLRFREILLHASVRYQLSCPTYCLMPDHVHILWIGQAPDSDQRLAIEFLRKHWQPVRLQQQAYDHVLREPERDPVAFETVAGYIFDNPVRAGIVTRFQDYELLGCIVPGYPEFDPRTADYWMRFWRVHAYLCQRLPQPPLAGARGYAPNDISTDRSRERQRADRPA